MPVMHVSCMLAEISYPIIVYPSQGFKSSVACNSNYFSPGSDYQQEQEAQQDEANVTPHTVEGTNDANRMNTLEIVEAFVLITASVKSLSIQIERKWLWFDLSLKLQISATQLHSFERLHELDYNFYNCCLAHMGYGFISRHHSQFWD